MITSYIQWISNMGDASMSTKTQYNHIPTNLTEEQFNEFICPQILISNLGRIPKLSVYKIFNYILRFLYTGVQWKELMIDKDKHGRPEIHYSSIFRWFKKWTNDGLFIRIFGSSVCQLQNNHLIDASILHGDGTDTVGKKGGDNLGRNGHKHHKSEKVVAISDRNANVISPFVTAPGNRNDTNRV